jgi:hypothetical protein
MSIATELLSLRRNRFSSVESLIRLLDWESMAGEDYAFEHRHFDVLQAADLVLLNVAAHAAEAQAYFNSGGTRRTIRALFRKRRGSDKPRSSQRLRKFSA